MSLFGLFSKKWKSTEIYNKKDAFCEEYHEVLVQYQNKHIVYSVRQGLVRYKNVISPCCGSCNFPEGYFEIKTLTLTQDAKKRVLPL